METMPKYDLRSTVKILSLEDLEDRSEVLEYWLSRPEFERVEHIQDLREHYEALNPEAADARRAGFRPVLRIVERERD
jgi:hypothetical protein